MLRDLLLDGTDRVVELYEETPRQGWKLARSASPGRLGAFEEELISVGEMADVPVVAAIWVTVRADQRHVGVAYVNPTTRELGACEFVDDEQFCALEAVVCQLGTKECVLRARRRRPPRAADSATSSLGAAPSPPSANPPTSTRATSPDDLARLLAKNDGAEVGEMAAAEVGARGGRRASQGAPREGRRRRHPRRGPSLLELPRRPLRITRRCVLSMHDTENIRALLRLERARALNVLPERATASSAATAERGGGSACTACSTSVALPWVVDCFCVGSSSRWWTRRKSRGVTVAVEASSAIRRCATRCGRASRARLPDIERITRKLERRRASSWICVDCIRRAQAALPYVAEALDRVQGDLGAGLRERSFSEKPSPSCTRRITSGVSRRCSRRRWI